MKCHRLLKIILVLLPFQGLSQSVKVIDTTLTWLDPTTIVDGNGDTTNYVLALPNLPVIWKNEHFDFENGRLITSVSVLNKKELEEEFSINFAFFKYPEAEEELDLAPDSIRWLSTTDKKKGVFGGGYHSSPKPLKFDQSRHEYLTKIVLTSNPIMVDKQNIYDVSATIGEFEGANYFFSKENYNWEPNFSSIILLIGDKEGYIFDKTVITDKIISEHKFRPIFPIKLNIKLFLISKYDPIQETTIEGSTFPCKTKFKTKIEPVNSRQRPITNTKGSFTEHNLKYHGLWSSDSLEDIMHSDFSFYIKDSNLDVLITLRESISSYSNILSIIDIFQGNDIVRKSLKPIIKSDSTVNTVINLGKFKKNDELIFQAKDKNSYFTHFSNNKFLEIPTREKLVGYPPSPFLTLPYKDEKTNDSKLYLVLYEDLSGTDYNDLVFTVSNVVVAGSDEAPLAPPPFPSIHPGTYSCIPPQIELNYNAIVDGERKNIKVEGSSILYQINDGPVLNYSEGGLVTLPQSPDTVHLFVRTMPPENSELYPSLWHQYTYIRNRTIVESRILSSLEGLRVQPGDTVELVLNTDSVSTLDYSSLKISTDSGSTWHSLQGNKVISKEEKILWLVTDKAENSEGLISLIGGTTRLKMEFADGISETVYGTFQIEDNSNSIARSHNNLPIQPQAPVCRDAVGRKFNRSQLGKLQVGFPMR